MESACEKYTCGLARQRSERAACCGLRRAGGGRGEEEARVRVSGRQEAGLKYYVSIAKGSTVEIAVNEVAVARNLRGLLEGIDDGLEKVDNDFLVHANACNAGIGAG